MSLYRLVYYSANRIANVPGAFDGELEDILAKSRRNNRLVGVTGALMFSAGYFGQVLEGPQAAIEATFERIQQDARHGDVSLLAFAPVADRAFESWAMAYVGEGDEGRARPAWNGAELDMSRISGEALFARLHDMVARAPASA